MPTYTNAYTYGSGGVATIIEVITVPAVTAATASVTVTVTLQLQTNYGLSDSTNAWGITTNILGSATGSNYAFSHGSSGKTSSVYTLSKVVNTSYSGPIAGSASVYIQN